MKKRLHPLHFLVAFILLMTSWIGVRAQNPFVSLSVPIGTNPSTFTQNFDGLPSMGNLTLSATGASLIGTNADGIYTNQLLLQTSTGAPNIVGVVPLSGQYSFGSDGSTDRALGSNSNVTNTALAPIRYGVLIKNTTGRPLASMTVSYTGEQWYNDGDNLPQSLLFDYVRTGSNFNILDGVGLLAGDLTVLGSNTYTSVSDLNFISPKFSNGNPVVLDGNAVGNRTARSATITFATPLPVNAYILLRWTDSNEGESIFNALDTDHSLAVDDLVVSANAVFNAPVLANAIPNQTGVVGAAYSYVIPSNTFTDADGDPLTLSVSNLPTGLTFNPATNTISGTPTTIVGSPFTVSVTATDPTNQSATTQFQFTINPANTPTAPSLGILPGSNLQVCIGQPLSLTVTGLEAVSGPVSISVSPNATVNVTNNVVTINNLPAGTVNLTVATSLTVAGQPFTVNQVVTVTVLNPQPPTVVTNQGQTYTAGLSSLQATQGGPSVLFTASCSAGVVSYTSSTGSTFSPGTAQATITIPTTTLGVVSYTATCGQGACVSAPAVASVNVVAGNQPPVVANPIPNQVGTVGVPYSYTIPANTFNDPNGDQLTLFVNNLPSGLNFNQNTNVISGTPTTTAGSPVTVGVTAVDAGAAQVSTTFLFTINPAPVNNVPPTVVNPIPNQTGTVGVPYSYTIPASTFNDPNGDALTLSVSNLPPGLNFTPGTNVISGTPSTTVGSPFTVTVKATDPGSLSTSTTFTFTVNPAPVNNQPPVVTATIPNQTGTVGTPYSYTIPANVFTDPNGTPVTVSMSNLPPGLNFNPGTGVISGTPSTTVGSPFTVTVTGTDPGNLSATTTFTFTVNPAPATNVPPTVTAQIPNQTGTVGTPYSYTIPANVFTDPNGTPVTVSMSNLPPGLNFNPATGVISGTPSTTVGSPFTVTVTGTDPGNLSASTTFTFTVNPAPVNNQPPVVTATIPNQTGTVGAPYSYTIPANVFTDPNGTPVTVSMSNLPPGLNFNPATGVISGTPSTTVGSPFTVTVTGTDPGNLSATTTFTFTVNPAAPPAGTFGIIGATVSCTFVQTGQYRVSITPQYTGLTGQPISFSIVNLLSPTTQPGPYILTLYTDNPNITLKATQSGSVGEGSYTFNFVTACGNVGPGPNRAPVVTATIPPQTGTVGTPFTYTIPSNVFTDPDGTPVTVSMSNLPPGLTFNPGTGVISGTPSTTVGSPFTVTVTGTDPGGLSATTTFPFTVNPAAVSPGNQAPVVTATIPNQTGTVGTPFTYTIPGNVFTDPNGTSVSVGMSNLPPGLNFNPATGIVSGTPSTTVGSPFTVTVTGTDPGGLSATTTFLFTVNPAATAGTFAITGATVSCTTVTPTQRRVSIMPQYSGLNGQPVTFRIVNELASTTQSGPYILTLYTDNPTIQLRATQAGTSGEASFALNWLSMCGSGNPNPGNQAPIVANTIPPQSGTVGTTFTYTIPAGTFTDPNGDPLTVTITNLPPGLTSNGGNISGTPTTPGTFNATVTARDPSGATVSTPLVITINPAAVTGTFAITGATVSCTTVTPTQRRVSIMPQYSGLNGQPITFRIVNELAATTQSGPYILTLYTDNPTIQLRATQAGTSGEASFALNWLSMCGNGNPNPGNQAPVVANTIPPQSGTVNVPFTYTIPAGTFTDPNGDPLTVSITNLPPGLTANGPTITGTPTAPGTYTVTVRATDPSGASVTTPLVITVNPPAGPTTGNCGTNLDGTPLRATMPIYDCALVTTTGAIQFTGAGGNPNGGPVEFMAIGITGWTTNCNAIIDFETRTKCDAPPIEIEIRQRVNGQWVYGQSFIYRIRQACPIAGCAPIQPGNRAPVVSAGIPNQVATVGKTYDYDVPANAFFDADGDHLLYTVNPLPESFTTSSGHFHATPTVSATYSVTVTAYDNNGGSAFTTFLFTVNPASGARASVGEVSEQPLSVRVFGNPTSGESVEIEVRGAAGKPLGLTMVDTHGRIISEKTIDKASATEQQTVRLGHGAGVYLLRVTTPGEFKTVKIIKQ